MTDATTIPLTIRTEVTYDTGDCFTRQLDVQVPPPGPGQDPADWAIDELLCFTGEGPDYATTEALYEVEVVASPSRPDLIGVSAAGQG